MVAGDEDTLALLKKYELSTSIRDDTFQVMMIRDVAEADVDTIHAGVKQLQHGLYPDPAPQAGGKWNIAICPDAPFINDVGPDAPVASLARTMADNGINFPRSDAYRSRGKS